MSMLSKTFVREIVLGLEDGFVSTFGTIAGIAVSTGNRQFVLLSGLVLIAVEATSMAAGAYLSSKSVADKRVRHPTMLAIHAGFVMWGCYAIGGLIPLAPYLTLSIPWALGSSTILTCAGLFAVGVWTGQMRKTVWWRSGLEMLLVSLFALVIGIVVGQLAEQFVLPGMRSV